MARRPVLQPRSIGVLIFEDFQLLDPKVQAFVRAFRQPPQALRRMARA